MTHRPTQGAQQTRAAVRRFVDTVVIPAEDILDAGERSALRSRARDEGLWALPLPSRWGGQDLPLAEYLELAEDEGRSDYGPEVLGSASLLTVRMLAAHGSPQLCAEVLPDLVSGRAASAFALTEPGVAGSDVQGLRTIAHVDTDGCWRVSGRKWFTTGGDADLVLVMARTDPGFTLLAVPAGTPGFTVQREQEVLGLGGQHELVFDEVRVPASHVVGAPGEGMRPAAERIALARTLWALRWVGQAQRSLELLAVRARERRSGAGVLADHQLVQRLAFESELAVRSARHLAREAADQVVVGARAPVEVSLAKTAAARALSIAADAAAQIFGAEGLTPGTGLPRLMRTARTARILDGPDELHCTTTGRRILGLTPR